MNMKRIRGRNHRPTGGGGGGANPYRSQGSAGGHQPMNRNHVFDSIGPDLRIRGTAQQLFEKYLQLGRDATGGGDRVMAESYFQHAEHYFRILNAMSQQQQPTPHASQQPQHNQQRRYQNGPEPQDGYGDSGEQPELTTMPNGHAAVLDADGDADGDMREPREPN
jgi:hypothetical protein